MDNKSGPDGAFWQTKTLDEMTADEWESLCDRCGKCCLLKLEDADTAEIYTTDVACKLLDCGTAQCTNYKQRKRHVLLTDRHTEGRLIPRLGAQHQPAHAGMHQPDLEHRPVASTVQPQAIRDHDVVHHRPRLKDTAIGVLVQAPRAHQNISDLGV